MPKVDIRATAGLVSLWLVAASPLWAQDATSGQPLSAIDWLSQSVARPGVEAGTSLTEPGVTTDSAVPADVAVSVLGGPSLDAIGLIPAAQSGLPRDLWGIGRPEDIAAAFASLHLEGFPALQRLLVTLLVTEADPPTGATSDGHLLMVRIDTLLSIGALDQARALIDAAGPVPDPELFRRNFDVALLTGAEDRACKSLRQMPEMAPALTTRIFCLAREGDWNAASVTLGTARALGHVSAEDDDLLSRFLDPAYADTAPDPVPPNPVTPLVWKIFEALGEPLPTATLPLAFAHAELGPTAGWKSQIEAAERLARAGAISPNLLLGLYTERKPAASGGVWDRVAAFQALDSAVSAGDAEAISRALPPAWDRMAAAELEPALSALFVDRLGKFGFEGEAGEVAFNLAMLSPHYADAAVAAVRGDFGGTASPEARARRDFLVALARGNLHGRPTPGSMARAIAAGFAPDHEIAPGLASMIEDGRTGEAILAAMARIADGAQGNLDDVSEGLALLVALGLEDVARHAAIELIILERRG